MTVKIEQMINYLASGPMTIYTVKKKVENDGTNVMASINPQYSPEDYGVIDLVNTGPLLAELQPTVPTIRLITPDAYASDHDQKTIIMIDSDYPA